MEQMIKINVPDGMEAIWDDKLQKVKFVKKESWRDIKTFDDVLNYLGIEADELYSLYSPNLNKCIPFNKWQLITEAFIKASNDELTLTTCDAYYPYCYIVLKDRANLKEREKNIGNCIINFREAFLVGGSLYSSRTGLCYSNQISVESTTNVCIGFRPFSKRSVAEHVSKYFAKELIEATLGWETDEIKWL